jgi:hypothetical protein
VDLQTESALKTIDELLVDFGGQQRASRSDAFQRVVTQSTSNTVRDARASAIVQNRSARVSA